MEKRLIKTLLRIVQSAESEFVFGAGLKDFKQRYGLGLPIGTTRIRFSERDKAELVTLLKAKVGVDAAVTSPASWNGLTRAEALELGHDEKLARGAVKRGRIAIKPVPGHVLELSARTLPLPEHAHLDVDWTTIESLGHELAVVVENYEVFDGLHRTGIAPALEKAGYGSALVLYRGDKYESRKDNVLAFLAAFELPVILFGDLDPASLVEAASFPKAFAFVAPVAAPEMFKAFGSKELYARQIGPAFERLLDTPSVGLRTAYGWIQHHRKGLVQESMIGRGMALEIVQI